MPITVNYNASAVTAQRYLAQNTTSLNQSLARLSSGYRITSSKDDAAGLQIANKLTSQIRGNAQAIQNAQEGLNVLSIADEALGRVSELMQESGALLIQLKNDTYSEEQKQAIVTQMMALGSSMDESFRNAQYGGKSVFNAYLDNSDFMVQIGANSDQATNQLKLTGGLNLQINKLQAHLRFEAIVELAFKEGVATSLGGEFDYDLNGQVNDADLSLYKAIKNGTQTGSAPTMYNIRRSVRNVVADYSSSGNITNALSLLTDFNESQLITTADINFSTQTGSLWSKSIFQTVNDQRSKIGALMNQLQSSIDNLTVTNENVSSARSRIQDVDVAKESANLSRRQILQQASASILTQANQQAQLALQLITGR